jgi:hypothetical protein
VRIQKADNGLYQAKLALDGVDQNELLIESTSGVLQGNLASTSGVLQGNINTVSGNLNIVSGNLTTVSGNVGKLLNFAKFDLNSRDRFGSAFGSYVSITALNTNVIPSSQPNSSFNVNQNTVGIFHFVYSATYTGGQPSCTVETSTSSPDSWIGLTTLDVQSSGIMYSHLFAAEFQQQDVLGNVRLRFRVGGSTTLTNFNINFMQYFALKGAPESGY